MTGERLWNRKKTALSPVRCKLLLGAAQNRYWIRLEHGIHSDNSQRMFDGLTHLHAVKRVAVYRGQRGEVTNTGFVERQARHLVLYPLGREIVLWGMRQR